MDFDTSKYSQSFCVLPWVHVASNSSGYLRLCCNSQPGMNILTNEKNEKLHFQKLENIEQIKNSPFLEKTRSEMLSGQWPETCLRCKREESVGVRSARQAWNEKYSSHIPKALESTDKSGKTSYFKGVYVDLRLGNLCNLKCRMCNPYASRKWLEDWNKIYEEKIVPSEVDRLNRLKWFEDEEVWEKLTSIVGKADEIYLTGGEPLLINAQTKLLAGLIERGLAEQITLKYNTNLTVLPDTILKFWPYFKEVKVNVSIDGTGVLNRYIRFPSEWKMISKNLNHLDKLANTNRRLKISTHTTVQVYNINKLNEIIDFLFQFENMNRIPYFNILNHPNMFNIKILPRSFKQILCERIEEWVVLYSNRALTNDERSSLDKLQNIANYMVGDDWSDQIPEFLKKTIQLDELRDESFKIINSEIFDQLTVNQEAVVHG